MAPWFLRLILICLTLIGSAFSTKLLAWHAYSFSANLLVLPFLFIFTGLMQLSTGFKFTLQSLSGALVANLIFIVYGMFIVALPSPSFAINNSLFDPLLQQPWDLIFNNLLVLSFAPFMFLLGVIGLQKLKLITTIRLSQKASLVSKSKYLSLIMVIYGVIILAANWYDPRFIKVFWFEVDSGTLVFPLTNILLDIVTEVYGYKNARLAIWCGFLINLIILGLGQITLHWPSFDATNILAYQHFLLFDVRVILASFISYFATEGLSAYVLAKLKILFQGRLMALRFVSSTFVGYLIDVLVFCIIAFTGLMNLKALALIMITSWVMMASIEIILLPLTVFISKQLKQRESLDIYDQNTAFTLLSLDSTYTKAQNKFIRPS